MWAENSKRRYISCLSFAMFDDTNINPRFPCYHHMFHSIFTQFPCVDCWALMNITQHMGTRNKKLFMAGVFFSLVESLFSRVFLFFESFLLLLLFLSQIKQQQNRRMDLTAACCQVDHLWIMTSDLLYLPSWRKCFCFYALYCLWRFICDGNQSWFLLLFCSPAPVNLPHQKKLRNKCETENEKSLSISD